MIYSLLNDDEKKIQWVQEEFIYIFEISYLGDASLYHLTNNQEYRLVVRFLFYINNTLFNMSFAINITS
jgi:hypothetical protein